MRNKTELGRVYYLTTRMVFPKDKGEFLRQTPIAGASAMAVYLFVRRLSIPDEYKNKLCETLECSWKDRFGVWIQMKIETTRRRDQNGGHKVHDFRTKDHFGKHAR